MEDATKKYQDLVKNKQPNMRMQRIEPIDPEDLAKEIERFNGDVQRMMEEMQRQMPFQPNMFPNARIMVGGRGFNRLGDGRLGVRLERVPALLTEQLDLKEDQGLVIVQVAPESAADKAGIRPNDILLEIAGKPVTNDVAELLKNVREIKADQKVEMVVLRKGKKETLKDVQIPEAPADQFRVQPRFNFPRIPNAPFPPEAFGNGNPRLSMMSISITNGQFTITCSEEGRQFKVVGTKEENGVKVTNIEVVEDGKTVAAESLEKLDEKYRPTVEKMLKSIR